MTNNKQCQTKQDTKVKWVARNMVSYVENGTSRPCEHLTFHNITNKSYLNYFYLDNPFNIQIAIYIGSIIQHL